MRNRGIERTTDSHAKLDPHMGLQVFDMSVDGGLEYVDLRARSSDN